MSNVVTTSLWMLAMPVVISVFEDVGQGTCSTGVVSASITTYVAPVLVIGGEFIHRFVSRGSVHGRDGGSIGRNPRTGIVENERRMSKGRDRESTGGDRGNGR